VKKYVSVIISKAPSGGEKEALILSKAPSGGEKRAVILLETQYYWQ